MQEDASIPDAALRETYEELRIPRENVEVLGMLDRPEYSLGNRARVWPVVVRKSLTGHDRYLTCSGVPARDIVLGGVKYITTAVTAPLVSNRVTGRSGRYLALATLGTTGPVTPADTSLPRRSGPTIPHDQGWGPGPGSGRRDQSSARSMGAERMVPQSPGLEVGLDGAATPRSIRVIT